VQSSAYDLGFYAMRFFQPNRGIVHPVLTFGARESATFVKKSVCTVKSIGATGLPKVSVVTAHRRDLVLKIPWDPMFKKVDRFLNLNHLSDCSTIAAPESGSKPKVVNAVSYAIPKRTKSSAWSAGDRSSKRTIKG
jgi:hypothetical protein